MKNLVKMPFFRLALLVLVVVILGLLLKKYVANRERFFNTNISGEFAVPVGLNENGSIMFKLFTDFKDVTVNNKKVKQITGLTVWNKNKDNTLVREIKDITMCDLCYKNNTADNGCKLNVYNKQTDPNTKKISYTRARPQGCPNYCDNNDCPETPEINVVVPNSSGEGSSNEDKYINIKKVMHVNCGKITDEALCAAHINCDFCGKDDSSKKCISTNLRDNKLNTPSEQCSRIKTRISSDYCKKNTGENCYPAIEEEDTVWNSIKNFFNVKPPDTSTSGSGNTSGSASSTGGSGSTSGSASSTGGSGSGTSTGGSANNFPSTFLGSLQNLSTIINQRLVENSPQISGNEVQSSINVVNKLENLLENSDIEQVNAFRNFSYSGGISSPAPFDTSFSPTTGNSSVSEFSRYKNYL